MGGSIVFRAIVTACVQSLGLVAVMVSLGSFGAFMRRHRGKIDLFFGAALWVTSLLILSRLATDGPGL